MVETFVSPRSRFLRAGRGASQPPESGHSSKGLEFPVVFIVDINEGTIPHRKATLEADLEEERRMFYVGMTRAKDRLHLYYAKERYGKKQDVSRFLDELRAKPAAKS